MVFADQHESPARGLSRSCYATVPAPPPCIVNSEPHDARSHFKLTLFLSGLLPVLPPCDAYVRNLITIARGCEVDFNSVDTNRRRYPLWPQLI